MQHSDAQFLQIHVGLSGCFLHICSVVVNSSMMSALGSSMPGCSIRSMRFLFEQTMHAYHVCIRFLRVTFCRCTELPIFNFINCFDLVPHLLMAGILTTLAQRFFFLQYLAEVAAEFAPIGLCYIMLQPSPDCQELVVFNTTSEKGRLMFTCGQVRMDGLQHISKGRLN